jgi:hypothetical protein
MVACPKCGAWIEVTSFGHGYVAICCGQMIYNDREFPDKKKKIENGGK